MSEENKQKLKEYQKNMVKQKNQHKKLLFIFFMWHENGTKSINLWQSVY